MALNTHDDVGRIYDIAVVTDINDPKKQGRVKLLYLGKQDDKNVPDDKQSWCEVVSPNNTQHRGVGVFPPHQFVVGTRVLVASTGQTKYVICAIQNYEDTQKEHQDMNREAQGSGNSMLVHSLPAGISALFHAFGSKYPYQYNKTKDALGFLLGKIGVNWIPGGRNQSILKNIAKPKYLDGGFGMGKNLPFNIGSFSFNAGDMTDPVKYIQSKIGTKGEIVPNALAMAQSLKEFGQKGINVNSITSVGGIGNITGAISGIASLRSSNSKANEDKENAEDLEAQLRQLYRDLFNKEPLNNQGLETEDYKKWKAEYLSNVDLSPYVEEETGATS